MIYDPASILWCEEFEIKYDLGTQDLRKLVMDSLKDLAELTHVELLSPRPEESVHFFHDMLGMDVVAQEGQSAYLRAYEERYLTSLKITESSTSGMAHSGLRARSAEALPRVVDAVKRSGLGEHWLEGDVGHGPAYGFRTPDGHRFEVHWDVDYYSAPPEQRTALLNRPQRRPNRGIPVKRLDHVNLLAGDPEPTSEFLIETLGFLNTERMIDEQERILASFYTLNALPHNVGMFRDPTKARGRLHHVCYFYGTAEPLYDLVDLLNDAGHEVERAPGKHGVAQGMFLYVFEPGGNRVELWGDVGMLVFDPAFETVIWRSTDPFGGVWVGAPTPESFIPRGTPPIDTGSNAPR